MPVTAQVAVSGTLYDFDMLFSYKVKADMNVSAGCRVLVPFGKGNSRRIGIVMGLEGDMMSASKYISAVIDEKPVISEELLKLAFHVREYTFCTFFEAVKVMLPPAMSIKVKEKFRIVTNAVSTANLTPKSAELLKNIKSADNPDKYIQNYLENNSRLCIDELCENNLIESDNIFRQSVNDASVKMVKLTDKYLSDPESFSLTPKQKAVADFLAENGAVAVKEVSYMCGVTDYVVKRLSENGVSEEYETEIFRYVGNFEENTENPEDIVLSEEQQSAYDRISSKATEKVPFVFLLHGVTGSGKTSVFEKLIFFVIQSGRQAMLLIPEIGLTPQVLSRFRMLFGQRVAVIHSGLTLGQRLDEYKRIRNGDADIVIGTRSAVFAPLNNIGIIIIDEEGERTYKSESSPRYSAHDIAKQRCMYHKCVLLLSSATPSIESYYFAKKGIYELVRLTKRYQDMPLPEVTIADMNEERSEGNKTEFSRILIQELNYNLENGEQSILLLNRRGFHTIISCVDCYKPLYCPNCSVPLTYHRMNNRLMCHYCGYSCEPVKVCPNCKSHRLKAMGFGTQKLEEELSLFFPTAKILRMDADTTFSRYSYEKNFTDFRNGKYDIMIGTQMIGKGLDFPDVTLVGVLSVDKSLYAGDFRSYERTFSLITQVVGRSGRGDKKGRAVLQTFMPEHYIMELSSSQDYEGFYNEEIAIRHAMIFPPYCDMYVFAFSGTDEEKVKKGAESVLSFMDTELRKLNPKTPVRVLGPVKASYGRINGRFRYRIIMKCKNTAEIRGFTDNILKNSRKLENMKNVSLYVDVNGDTGV